MPISLLESLNEEDRLSTTGSKKERRRQSRKQVGMMVPILWEDEQGHETPVLARLLDISVSGARLWIRSKLPSRAPVSFNCAGLGVGGRGTVRYCNLAKGGGYEVGLELSNGTGWREARTSDVESLAIAVRGTDQSADRSKNTSDLVNDRR